MFFFLQIQHSRGAEDDRCALLGEDGHSVWEDDALHHYQTQPGRVLCSSEATVLHQGQPTRQLRVLRVSLPFPYHPLTSVFLHPSSVFSDFDDIFQFNTYLDDLVCAFQTLANSRPIIYATYLWENCQK